MVQQRYLFLPNPPHPLAALAPSPPASGRRGLRRTAWQSIPRSLYPSAMRILLRHGDAGRRRCALDRTAFPFDRSLSRRALHHRRWARCRAAVRGCAGARPDHHHREAFPWRLHWLLLYRAVALARWDIVVDLRASALSYLLWVRERYIAAEAPVWASIASSGWRASSSLDLPPPPRLWIAPPRDAAEAAAAGPRRGARAGDRTGAELAVARNGAASVSPTWYSA